MCKFILISLSILLCFGCQHIIIPPGKFVPNKGEEYIVVKPSTMFFHLKVIGNLNVFIDKEYGYNVSAKSGAIIPYGMRSGEYWHGLRKYDLKWDGKDIIVMVSKTRAIRIFKRLPQHDFCQKNKTQKLKNKK